MVINVWAVIEHVRVASGAAELAIFTAILYWFFTSSRVADMLELVGERVGGWCGRDSGTTTSSLRQTVRARRRQNHADIYAKIDTEKATRTTSLYRVKEGPIVPAPQPLVRPAAGLACARCAPLSRESWQDPKSPESDAVIDVMDIGRQAGANGGVISRYLCDIAHCCNLEQYDYKDVVPDVMRDERFQQAIEDTAQQQMRLEENSGALYDVVKGRVEARASRVLRDISSAMSNTVLKLVAWVCHKAIRRIAGGGCSTRASCAERLRRSHAAGLPVVLVPLHRSHFDYILVTFALYLSGLRPPLVAAGDNMRIPFFGWFLRGCGAFYIRRRVDGSEQNDDLVYKTALRAYILNSLSANNNLEFFIEGGRTRTGKPQLPKAGILSVIMDAYLDGTIDDALLVPVTLNYDKLVDGNFVREQLGMPKQMETFWMALRGIWRTLNTNHGGIRVDFNQPISLKELVTSFQKFNYLKAPVDQSPSPPNNNLALTLDRQILYNHSHSSLYGDNVSTEHKMMVEGIGRHLVYDAARSTALMSTNVVAYVLLTERRSGCCLQEFRAALQHRSERLQAAGRDLGYSGDTNRVIQHAVEMLGRSLVRRTGSGERQALRACRSIPASLELCYYANAISAHYAPSAIVATAIECIAQSESFDGVLRHSEIMEWSLRLSELLSQEFILCPPCTRIEDLLADTLHALQMEGVIVGIETNDVLEEERWARRFAKNFDEDEDYQQKDPTANIKYKLSTTPEATAERRRLVLTIRPLVEAYAATCRRLPPPCSPCSLKDLVKNVLDHLTDLYSRNQMPYGEAVSTDAIRNCLRLLKQWGVIEMSPVKRDRVVKILPPYDNPSSLEDICANIYKFNVNTPLLNES